MKKAIVLAKTAKKKRPPAVLQRLDQVRAEIAKATTLEPAKGIRDQLKAAIAYAQSVGSDRPLLLDLAEHMIEATANLGAVLERMAAEGTRHRGAGDQKSASQRARPILKDIGITWSASSRAQQIAQVTPAQRTDYYASVRKKDVGEITSAVVLERMAMEGTRSTGGQPKEPSHAATVLLKDIGLSRSASSRAQQIAKVTPCDWEMGKVLGQMKAAGLLDAGKGGDRKSPSRDGRMISLTAAPEKGGLGLTYNYSSRAQQIAGLDWDVAAAGVIKCDWEMGLVLRDMKAAGLLGKGGDPSSRDARMVSLTAAPARTRTTWRPQPRGPDMFVNLNPPPACNMLLESRRRLARDERLWAELLERVRPAGAGLPAVTSPPPVIVRRRRVQP